MAKNGWSASSGAPVFTTERIDSHRSIVGLASSSGTRVTILELETYAYGKVYAFKSFLTPHSSRSSLLAIRHIWATLRLSPPAPGS